LTLKDLKPIKTTLEDVQADLLKLVGPEVILVGHGLVHDLKVGRCRLKRVETSVDAYAFRGGEGCVNGGGGKGGGGCVSELGSYNVMNLLQTSFQYSIAPLLEGAEVRPPARH